MATIQQIIASNGRLCESHKSTTAVFTGVTHGIGLETLKALLRYIPKPKAILIGRSRAKFASELDALHQLNPDADISFIETELSLISEVDRTCEVIKQQAPQHSIDLLCMSQGYAPLGPRLFNKEGIDESMTLGVYGRVRLAEKLINQAMLSTNARVVSILGGGKEDKLFLEDMELKENWSVMKLRGHFTSMMTLAFDHLASRNPNLGFVHYFPGTVSTGMRNRIPNISLLTSVSMFIISALFSFKAITPKESGERTLGTPCFGQDFERGSFSIDLDGTLGASEHLKEYRKDDQVSKKVWEHLEELWERAGVPVAKA
ncbi:hypothetical protein PRZ48_014579 [Zasmidium cellare]|uniref:NAD(P)-binding protein n=1 Tax=Zasmidium cellare TaxID=395010 RepID=A0ABR0DYM5_ZASCE|nr:hypothetical protein PRZ48_014579 [Zasmidium cellare]